MVFYVVVVVVGVGIVTVAFLLVTLLLLLLLLLMVLQLGFFVGAVVHLESMAVITRAYSHRWTNNAPWIPSAKNYTVSPAAATVPPCRIYLDTWRQTRGRKRPEVSYPRMTFDVRKDRVNTLFGQTVALRRTGLPQRRTHAISLS